MAKEAAQHTGVWGKAGKTLQRLLSRIVGSLPASDLAEQAGTMQTHSERYLMDIDHDSEAAAR
ncbi:hypothetical protein [Mycobacterium lepromatosis]|uniref:hypothetical protein n=1 Tax=Mycobacterium lepromatosis TaxID=480418 RepID=UPI0005F82737|nr:hypothetical protein [Mycobacterium lepromatosis]